MRGGVDVFAVRCEMICRLGRCENTVVASIRVLYWLKEAQCRGRVLRGVAQLSRELYSVIYLTD